MKSDKRFLSDGCVNLQIACANFRAERCFTLGLLLVSWYSYNKDAPGTTKAGMYEVRDCKKGPDLLLALCKGGGRGGRKAGGGGGDGRRGRGRGQEGRGLIHSYTNSH